MTSESLQEFDVVALTEDLPAFSLSAGQTGAVVYVHNDSACEVEFPFAERNSVVATVARDKLLKLKGQHSWAQGLTR